MPLRYLLTTFAVLLFGTSALAVDPSDLKPGLVTRYAESEKEAQNTAIHRLEPTVALTLNPGETPHPRLAQGGYAVWSGYINIVRPGKYTFSSTLLGGKLSVLVNGKSVYSASANEETLTKSGEEVVLDGGVQPFTATFLRNGGAARVELFWQGPGFVKEPLPHQFLGHLSKDRPAAFAKDVELELGRFKFEELSCIRCHKPTADDKMAKGLAERAGPSLTEIGKHAYPGWIDAWLAAPAKLRPQTTMPAMFTTDEQGRAERYAVTKYLLSLSGTPLVPTKLPVVGSNDVRQSTDRGRVLYTVAGCTACHQEAKPKAKNEEDDREPLKPEDYFTSLGTTGPTSKYLLGAMGGKTRFEPLTAYLQNPLKTNPHGRMPQMNLSSQEATDLARYLCRMTEENFSPEMPPAPKIKPMDVGRKAFEGSDVLKARDELADELAAIEKQSAEKQWVEIGRKLVVAKGCVDCHTIEQGGKALVSGDLFPKLAKIKTAESKGCIAEKPDPAKVPVYKLEAKETAAITAFLTNGLTGAGSPAPAYNARVALRRFNCLNCHSRDGEGGIPTDLADQMRLMEKAENADDVRPPLLTGIGHKSRTSWLKSVLMGSGRARPWMQLRMPQYGEANVTFLPEALASLEGSTPDDSVFKLPISGPKVQLGKQIVGKSGLGCISCHDIGGVPNTGTRGPDLATIDQRVRYEWYERWLHQPLRMAPGTRMPQAFVEGKSTLGNVLNGDPKGQAEAMWSYLSLGPGLPLPEGLEPPKGLIISAKDRPEILRTFMPEAGSKAIAVGYPGGLSVAFSADQCRLAYAWGGNFLDASPVWANRGGAPAKLLGPKFWSASPGHPWALTVNPNIPPDFLGRANNPAFGLALPLEPARIYDGPRVVNFDGYSLDSEDRPIFRYTLRENEKDGVLKVAETIIPLKASVATGFIRRFAVDSPAGYRAWLLSGQSGKEPRAYTTAGVPISAFDVKIAEPFLDASGSRLVLPLDGDKAIVLEASGAPAGTIWRVVAKAGGGWLVLLRLPESKENWKGTFDLVTWALPKDEELLLKDLGIKP
jgi:mono/diheme cytochrome c family protein